MGLYFIQEGFLAVVVPPNNEAHGLVREEYLLRLSYLHRLSPETLPKTRVPGHPPTFNRDEP